MSSPMLILSILKKPTSIEKLQTEDRPFWKSEYRIIIYYIGNEFLFVKLNIIFIGIEIRVISMKFEETEFVNNNFDLENRRIY